jgi:hypothetical protein
MAENAGRCSWCGAVPHPRPEILRPERPGAEAARQLGDYFRDPSTAAVPARRSAPALSRSAGLGRASSQAGSGASHAELAEELGRFATEHMTQADAARLLLVLIG